MDYQHPQKTIKMVRSLNWYSTSLLMRNNYGFESHWGHKNLKVMASKYIAVYNGNMFPFDDKIDFATKIMGYKLSQNENGSWNVIINGEIVAKYSNEYTKEEVEKAYFKDFFSKNTYKNLKFYQLV